MYQLKTIAGGFDDLTWPTDADSACDKSTCYEIEIDTDAKGSYQQCCYGHYEYDQFLDYVNGDVNSYIGDTNRATVDATDASSKDYSMPYIYDDLSFSHCTSEKFATIVENLINGN